MIRKKLAVPAFLFAFTLLLSACEKADVVGKTAVTSFDTLTGKLGQQVAFDESKNAWVITTEANDYFELNKDFSGDKPDAAVEFDAAPFINAGLKPDSLNADQYSYDAATGRIRMPFELSQDKFEDSKSMADTFSQVVKTNRKIIGYHAQLDHYGISLGNGNMFEWAKDLVKNDKDMVLVLNPQPFIDAGVDTSKVVEGWVFGKVKVDEDGKAVEVEKFLKPFNLE